MASKFRAASLGILCTCGAEAEKKTMATTDVPLSAAADRFLQCCRRHRHRHRRAADVVVHL